MKHQQTEGVAAETGSRPEAQRPGRCRWQLLLLIVAAFVGAVVGAMGMYYVGTRDGVLPAIDNLLGHQGATRDHTASEAGPDEAGREGGAVSGGDEKKRVPLTENQIKQLGIEVAVARAGSVQTFLTLPGTIALNADRRVHVISRLPGIVQEIRKQLGDGGIVVEDTKEGVRWKRK